MQAGRLNCRVTVLRRKDGARSRLGQPAVEFVEVGKFWAEVRPLGGRELLVAKQVSARLTHAVRVRGRVDVRAADRLKLGDRVLEIESVADRDERHEELILQCGEVVT